MFFSSFVPAHDTLPYAFALKDMNHSATSISALPVASQPSCFGSVFHASRYVSPSSQNRPGQNPVPASVITCCRTSKVMVWPALGANVRVFD